MASLQPLNSALVWCSIEDPTTVMNFTRSFPIQVNEAKQTVTVQAGVTQRMLLDYLANYTYDIPRD
jgi:FAD/FMN-containing dehydrogenase